MAAVMVWPLLWAVLLATSVQLEVEAPVRKLEDLKLGKHLGVSTTLPFWELADKVGEQDN